MRKHLILASLCLAGIANASDNQRVTYKNQRGSTLVLKWHEAGVLTGTFSTAVGNCPDVNTPVPVSGFYVGNAISISVIFPRCKAVVAMTANVSDKKDEMRTLWLDAHPAQDPAGKDWNTNLVGTDFYKRVG